MMPEIAHRHGNIFSERALTIHAHADGMSAQLATTSQAIAASTTDQMAFTTDQITDFEIIDVATEFNHMANEFVADHQRHRNGALGPGIPIINMQIRAADAGAINADEYVVYANFWHRHVDQSQSRCGGRFSDGFHAVSLRLSWEGSGHESTMQDLCPV
jgi:hypothetical protein